MRGSPNNSSDPTLLRHPCTMTAPAGRARCLLQPGRLPDYTSALGGPARGVGRLVQNKSSLGGAKTRTGVPTNSLGGAIVELARALRAYTHPWVHASSLAFVYPRAPYPPAFICPTFGRLIHPPLPALRSGALSTRLYLPCVGRVRPSHAPAGSPGR